MLLGGATIDLNLVPFGLQTDTRDLLDVHEVPKGKGCGCTCPSCGMPLVARQGRIREWHFAHLSRDARAIAQRECEYSFFVSVKLMAKQLLGEEMTLRLPAYYGSTHPPSFARPREGAFRFLVTKARSITLGDLQTDVSVDGVTVDIQGNVGDYSLAIYLAHKGRPVPASLRASVDPSCGIIAISLDRTRILFRESRRRGSNYRTDLVGFLADDLDSKQWVYHPRNSQAEQQAEQQALAVLKSRHELQSALREARGGTGLKSGREVASTRTCVVFECMICRITWSGIEESASACPKCATHLFRRVKQRIHGAP